MQKTTLRVPSDFRMRQPLSGNVRIPFLQRCRVSGPDGEQQGLICDLSTAGIYVRLDRLPDWGTVVHVTFDLFPGDPIPMQVDAEVVWQNVPEQPRVPDLPPGCGLRFVQTSPGDAARIAALVTASTSTSFFPA
jgi:hypothetical protein